MSSSTLKNLSFVHLSNHLQSTLAQGHRTGCACVGHVHASGILQMGSSVMLYSQAMVNVLLVFLSQIVVESDMLLQRDWHKSLPYRWDEVVSSATIPAIVVMAYAFLFFWFVSGISCFHTYLISTNQTTYEQIR